jgi:hypothetical protein
VRAYKDSKASYQKLANRMQRFWLSVGFPKPQPFDSGIRYVEEVPPKKYPLEVGDDLIAQVHFAQVLWLGVKKRAYFATSVDFSVRGSFWRSA